MQMLPRSKCSSGESLKWDEATKRYICNACTESHPVSPSVDTATSVLNGLPASPSASFNNKSERRISSTSQSQKLDPRTHYSPDTFKVLLKRLVHKPEEFDLTHLELAIEHISSPGATTQAQIASWLTAIQLHSKHLDHEFLAKYAQCLRRKAFTVELPDRKEGEWVLDIVGTGGDGQDTFNASTAAAIVASGVDGVRVCKHGSKASTSKSGSADFLVELEVPIQSLPIANLPLHSHFLFLFALLYHPTFAITSPIRRELGFPTIFNLLGPLINPAKIDAMVLGVYSKELGMLFAKALRELGFKRAWVVCGEEGLDEISPEGKTNVWDLATDGEIRHFQVSPADFGLQSHSLSAVKSGTSYENARTFRLLLDSQLEQDSPIETFVVINTAALLFVGGKTRDLKEGVRLARESIKSGKAKRVLEDFGKNVRDGVERAKKDVFS